MPDGLNDFVDALNNPKEFLSKEEKRLKQLQERLGIDEKEISIVPIEKKASKANGLSNAESTRKKTNLPADNKKGINKYHTLIFEKYKPHEKYK